MITPKKETQVKVNYAADEPMLIPSNDRFVLFPIEHDDIWQAYKDQAACFWTAEELDLKKTRTTGRN